MQTLADLDVSGQRVLVRCDLNVPLGEPGPDGVRAITDDGRIRASLRTIEDLLERRARVIICAHLGRPGGEVVPELSLAPVARRLGELLGTSVRLAEDIVGPGAQAAVAATGPGEIVLLENVRFSPEETTKDDVMRGAFAAQLAALADLYVGDGFGAVHRKHASVYDVPLMLPHAAGRLITSEVEVLQRLTRDPARPYVVVLGGAKVSDKLAVIGNLLKVVDRLVIGGGMAYTFLAAQGHAVGTSLLEPDLVPTVQGLLAEAAELGVDVVLPVDVRAARTFAADADYADVPVEAIPDDRMGLDIGPESGRIFAAAVRDARTVFWNGPMGVFEFPNFAEGTRLVAQALTETDAFTVIGGGDSAAAVRQLGFPESAFGHLSTGGGASLEYLEGKELPGLQALESAR